MKQLTYINTRTALKREMTELGNWLVEANTDLEKFKDVSISVHDHDSLLVTLETYQDMLQRKMTLCNDNLRQLHSTIEHVYLMKRIGVERFVVQTQCNVIAYNRLINA